MAKGTKDLDIVTELDSFNSYNDYLTNKNGLVVCEPYQEWAGPCMVMRRFLKKAKFELLEGEECDLVHFFSIKVDLIPAFRNLRGKCVPTYLFFGGKNLVHVFRGHEASTLMPLIRELVKREKSCMSGRFKRCFLSVTNPLEIPPTDPKLCELEALPFTESEEKAEPPAASADVENLDSVDDVKESA